MLRQVHIGKNLCKLLTTACNRHRGDFGSRKLLIHVETFIFGRDNSARFDPRRRLQAKRYQIF